MILLDTDVCIEILRGNETVIRRRRTINDTVGISFMTAAELYYGAYRSNNAEKNKSLVEKFLVTVNVHQSDLRIMDKFGEIKERLQSKGQSLADADVFIAATAMCNNGTLVTGNMRHYERIDGLKVENWLQKENNAL